MKRFTSATRVRVVAEKHLLFGKTGAIARIRRNDNGAWVRMDEALPKELQSFSDGDDRSRHVVLYPEDCEAV